MSNEFYKALVAYLEFTQGVNLKYNEDCVKYALNYVYWDAYKKLNPEGPLDDNFGLYLFLGIAIGAVIVIAILLLIIYFKRKGDDEEETDRVQ